MRMWAHPVWKISLLFIAVYLGSSCGSLAAAQSGDGQDSPATTATPATQDDSPAKSAHVDPTYIIGDDDVLAINVWKENEITRAVTVRSDGKISLPLIGDVQAAGRTPMQLEEDIAERLKSYITDPQVTVIVQQTNSQKFNILGQIAKPGSYPLTAGTTIVDAIALAGGFKDFARRKSVYVLRQNPAGAETRINFNYDKFIKGKNSKNPAQNIPIKPHDTIVVP